MAQQVVVQPVGYANAALNIVQPQQPLQVSIADRQQFPSLVATPKASAAPVQWGPAVTRTVMPTTVTTQSPVVQSSISRTMTPVTQSLPTTVSGGYVMVQPPTVQQPAPAQVVEAPVEIVAEEQPREATPKREKKEKAEKDGGCSLM